MKFIRTSYKYVLLIWYAANTYDANGNLKTDLNKSITNIDYNHLNLPQKVAKNTQNYNPFVYSATETMLGQETYTNGTKVSQTDYCGPFIYQSNRLEYVTIPGGRIKYTYTNGVPTTTKLTKAEPESK